MQIAILCAVILLPVMVAGITVLRLVEQIVLEDAWAAALERAKMVVQTVVKADA